MSTSPQVQPKKLRGAFKTEFVTIPDQSGMDRLYCVREFDGVGRSNYMEWLNAHSVPVPGGEPGEVRITSLDGMYAVLVGPCLFACDQTTGRPLQHPVDAEFVRHGLPDETLAELSQISRKLNGIGKAETEAEKKDS